MSESWRMSERCCMLHGTQKQLAHCMAPTAVYLMHQSNVFWATLLFMGQSDCQQQGELGWWSVNCSFKCQSVDWLVGETQHSQLIGKHVRLTHWGSLNETREWNVSSESQREHWPTVLWLEQGWVQWGWKSWTPSHHPTSCVGVGTSQRSRDPSRPESDAPPAGGHHSSSTENSWPSMLYCTKRKKNTNTSHTHRMSADCYFFRVTSCSSIFRNDFWLFRKQNSVILL